MLVQIDWFALLLVFAIGLLSYFAKLIFAKQKIIKSFAFPSLKNRGSQISLRAKFYWVPRALYYLALLCFLLAFVDPHLASNKNPENNPSNVGESKVIPTEGVAIYLLLDQSGSMAQTISIKEQGKYQQLPKIELLKQVTEKFILERVNDLMGLIYFARIPRVIAPLTLDHQLLVKELQRLKVVEGQEEDGTSLGYAIFKAAHLIAATRHYAETDSGIEPQYQINSAVIIAITDGMQDPNYLDKGNRLRTIELEEAAEFAKSQEIKIYVINIDATFATEKYAPHRRQMQKITQLTGGEFYLADESKDLAQIYTKINQLEKSQLPQSFVGSTMTLRYFSFYPYLISFGMICFLLASLLESFYFKSIP